MTDYTHLQLRRIAAYAVKEVCQSYPTTPLGNKAVALIGDNPDEWDVSGSDINALVDGKVAAHVHIIGDIALVCVPDWYGLIRPEHIPDFDPAEHGLETDSGYNPATGEPFDDDEIEVRIDNVPNLNAPEVSIPRTPRRQPIQVIASR